jgi:hypothetical protein
MLVITKTAVSEDSTLCSLVNVYWQFRIMFCFHLKGVVQAVYFGRLGFDDMSGEWLPVFLQNVVNQSPDDATSHPIRLEL